MRDNSRDSLKTGVSHDAPGFLRRLAAICYDSLLLLALLFVATAIVLPVNRGAAFAPGQFYYPAYLLAVSFAFFGWFWTHGGQTLGMRAWKIKVMTLDRQPLTWKHALVRFCAALLSWAISGLGFLWILISREHRAWHDSLSRTALFLEDR